MTTTLQQLSVITECELQGDGQYLIDGVGSLATASSAEAAFYSDSRKKSELGATRAGVVILTQDNAGLYSGNKLISDDPNLSFLKLTLFFNPSSAVSSGYIDQDASVDPAAEIAATAIIDSGCVIAANAIIGEHVVIGANTVIGSGVSIGADSRLDAGVVIYHDCRIGERCVISAGTVIGGQGFGYLHRNRRWLTVPQLGRVVIGDDVDVGANTAIDRGTVDDTIIANGVKIDNLVQIGHNVVIGEHTILSGCVAIAGSVVIGKHCKLGGRVSVTGHLEVVDSVSILATSLVSSSIHQPGVYSSALPVKPVKHWRRAVARLSRLDDLSKRFKKLEKQNK